MSDQGLRVEDVKAASKFRAYRIGKSFCSEGLRSPAELCSVAEER
jgi:hypothetical protein